MATKQLRPHLNQIRDWVRQGRTDAWIAHQLDASADEIAAFKRDQSLSAEADVAVATITSPGAEEELDLRAEDDALIAAELEAALAKREAEAAASGEEGEDGSGRRRRRGRRGGRGRRRPAFEATFDHGEEGYGLWLDPAIVEDPVYAEHWAGHRPITVQISSDQIVIQRSVEEESNAGDSESKTEEQTEAA